MKHQGPYGSTFRKRSPIQRSALGRNRRKRRPGLALLVAATALLSLSAAVLAFSPPSAREAVVGAFRSLFAHASPTPAPTPTTSPPPTATPAPTTSPTPSPSPTPVSTPVPTISPIPGATALTKLPAVNTAEILYGPDLSKYVGREKSSTALTGITVMVDPGHGGYTGTPNDYGASYNGVKEAHVNWAVATRLKAELEALGARVILTRENDDDKGSFRSLHYRVARVAQEVFAVQKSLASGSQLKELERLESLFLPSIRINSDSYSSGGRSIYKGLGANPDLRTILDIQNQHKDIVFVSVHCNALPTWTSMHGLEVYWASRTAIYNDEREIAADPKTTDKYPISPSYQFYDDVERRRFAIALRDSILGLCPELAYPATENGQIPEGNYAVLREENVVSAMVEMGYLTNPDDFQRLMSDDYRLRIAQGIADGIFAYFCR